MVCLKCGAKGGGEGGGGASLPNNINSLFTLIYAGALRSSLLQVVLKNHYWDNICMP